MVTISRFYYAYSNQTVQPLVREIFVIFPTLTFKQRHFWSFEQVLPPINCFFFLRSIFWRNIFGILNSFVFVYFLFLTFCILIWYTCTLIMMSSRYKTLKIRPKSPSISPSLEKVSILKYFYISHIKVRLRSDVRW